MRDGVLPSEISPRRMGVAVPTVAQRWPKMIEARQQERDVSQQDSSMRVPMAKRRQMERKRMWVDE